MTEEEYFKSNKFKEDFRKKVEEDTWEKETIKIIKDNATKKEDN